MIEVIWFFGCLFDVCEIVCCYSEIVEYSDLNFYGMVYYVEDIVDVFDLLSY